MMKVIGLIGLIVGTVAMCGCSVKSGLYTLGGTAAGAGVGYSYHHDGKGAAIGGLAGGTAGALLGGLQDNSDKARRKAGYEEGYKRAQLDVAVRDWEENTGKNSVQDERPKRLIEVKVPKQEENDVIYDEHYVTLEDYR
jgi:hypothetical protein